MAASLVVGFAPTIASANVGPTVNLDHKIFHGHPQPVGSDPNPTLPNSCGLDIALVLDTSASISSSELTSMKSDFTNFVNLLAPTPTDFSVTQFNTVGHVVHAFTLVDSDTTTAINGITTSTGHTNFQSGLATAAGTFDPRLGNGNVIVLASDGDPNTINNGTFTTTTNAENAAVTEANTIKGTGTKIITLGIGNNLHATNLEKLSSPEDYYQASDYADLNTALQQVATDLCGGTITVQKMIDVDGTDKNNTAAASGWDFTVGGQDAVTDNTGKTPAVAVNNGSESVVETAQTGYSLEGVTCSDQNGAIDTSPVENGVSLNVNPLDVISCTATNVPNTATLHIVKDVVGTNTAISNFTYKLDGADPVNFVGSDTSGENDVTVSTSGTHSVTEPAAENYVTTYSNNQNQNADCNDLTTAPNSDVTCTITNTYVPPVITCNDNAETDIVSDATTADDSGTTVVINPSDIPGVLPGPWVDPSTTAALTGAQWIWSDNYLSDDTTVAKTEKFTKTFNISGSVTDGSIDLSTDNGYVLIVNGTQVDSQNVDPDNEQNYSSVHHYDIGSDLHSGSNTVEIDVTNFGRDNTTFANNPGGLVYRVVVHANECNQSTSCVAPNTDALADPQVAIGSSGEETLQAMLDGAGYSINDATDQKAITSWTGNGSETANFVAKFINRAAAAVTTFGYYANGSTTFSPLFTEAPGAATPQTVPFSIPSFSKVVFGISSVYGATNTYTTDPAFQNTDGTNQHALVYHPSADEYVMGFEDLPLATADKDYNDMTVSVSAGACTPADNTPTTATLHVTKIVCDNESDLPNWGAGDGGNITASTATTFLANHPDCHLQSGWNFDWAPAGTANPGDNLEAAGSPWTTFGVTDGSGTVSTQVPVDGGYVWAREELKSGYIPFTYGDNNNDSNNVSAEFYCNVDHLHYDNYDRVDNLVAGQDYYCVAFNAPVAETPPTDVCPNIDGVQTEVPQGDVINDDGQCVPADVGPTTATLTIIKNTDSESNNGSFTFDVAPHDSGTDIENGKPTLDTVGGSATSGAITLDPGSYDVSEEVPDGWTYNGVDCQYDGGSVGTELTHGESITVDAGDSVTCTFTNTKNEGPDISVDVCANFPGNQATVPPGYHVDGSNYCIPDNQPGFNGGGGGGGGGGWSGGGGGGGGGSVLGDFQGKGSVLGASCGLYMNKHIKFGSSKNDPDQVSKLQQFLNQWMGTNLPITGVYDKATLAAVNAFQKKYGDQILKPWGISGPTGLVYLSTLREINLLQCPDLSIQLPALVPWNQNPGAQ